MPTTNPSTGNALGTAVIPRDFSVYLPADQFNNANTAAKAVAGLGYTPAPQVAKENVASPWTVPTIYSPDPLRASVEAASGGRNTVLYDASGNPSYMVLVPRFRLEDIDASLGSGTHPAFLVNGTQKPYLFIGQYLASLISGKACSLPGRDPANSITWDASKAACTAKNGGSVTGWHMMTAWEWAAVALWCLKNGYQPRGNTYYGQAHDAVWETAPRIDSAAPALTSGTGRSLAGLGPASWRHNGNLAGIADLVGNVWEWQDGLKLVDGQFVGPADNYYGLAEASWPAMGVFLDSSGTTGTDTNPDGNGAPILSGARTVPSDDCGDGLGANAPDYDYSVIGGESGARSMSMSSTYDALAAATRQKMMQLLIAHKPSSSGSAPFAAKGYIAARNYGERMPIRGGRWSSGGSAGLAALDLNARRSYASGNIGFRPVFCP